MGNKFTQSQRERKRSADADGHWVTYRGHHIFFPGPARGGLRRGTAESTDTAKSRAAELLAHAQALKAASPEGTRRAVMARTDADKLSTGVGTLKLQDPAPTTPKRVRVVLPPIQPHNTIVFNGPFHVGGVVDNHDGERCRSYFSSIKIPNHNMFDFNSLSDYSNGFRAAVEKARQKTRATGPPDIIVYAHGAPGVILFGEKEGEPEKEPIKDVVSLDKENGPKPIKDAVSLDKEDEPTYLDFVNSLKLLLTDPASGRPSGKLIILGCNVGSGVKGNALLRRLEKDLGVPVYGATNGSTDIQGRPNFSSPTMTIDKGGSVSRPTK